MKKGRTVHLFLLSCVIMLLMYGTASAADKVVVIPLGGTVGNATAADVVKGKTFSSKTAGKGASGTLDLPPTMQRPTPRRLTG
jgi:membrane-bound ClpP family serine protease